jgi:hypothetical protein
MSEFNKIFPIAYAKMTEIMKAAMPDVVSPWGMLDQHVLIFGDSVPVAQFAQVGIEVRHVELSSVRSEPVAFGAFLA